MIGVFDSGIGGLTVHRALVNALPKADFVYFADQANAPYGGRRPEEIVALTRAGCIRLFEEGASLVVLACNTAAAIALHTLQQDWLPGYREKVGRPVNVIGLIVPTIEVATGLGWHDASPARTVESRQTLGIFATPATVRAEVYATEIHKRRPDIRVLQEPCSDLARLIERGTSRSELQVTIRQHVQALCAKTGEGQWKAILGCTHYEIVADLFTSELPPGTPLIHQPSATADALIRYLARHPQYVPGMSGIRRFITTGAVKQSELAEEFWGSSLAFEMLMAA